MYYVDLKTCLQQPISWIDEEGNYFFPNFVAGSTEEPNNIMEREDKEINEANESKLRKYSREFGAATKNVKVDDHAITTKTGDGNVAITIKKVPDTNFDYYTESLYGKLDVDTA